MEVSAFTFMALLVAREGTLVTGGHQIMSNLAALCYMMPMALGVATAALTAQAIGAGKLDQAHRIGMAGLTLGLMGALLTAAVLLIGRPLILAAYTDKAEVAAVAATLLAVLRSSTCSIPCSASTPTCCAPARSPVPLLLQTVALAGVGLVGGWWFGFGPGKGGLDWLRLTSRPDRPRAPARCG